MNFTDRRFLLDVAYRGWQHSHATNLEVAGRVAGEAAVPRKRSAAARAEGDQALADYLLVDQQRDVDDEVRSANGADRHRFLAAVQSGALSSGK